MPDLGVGVGLRTRHYAEIFDQGQGASVDWLEIISENFMVGSGLPLHNLGRALDRFPVVQHGVSLSIGGTDPLDWEYLAKLKALAQRTGTPWVSDHLCWGSAAGVHLHDLVPLPYTAAAVKWVAARARAVQDFLGLRLALENVSSYMTYTSSEMTEWEFVTAVAEEADCGLLLDVNNIYVSSYNHSFDPNLYVDGVPHERVMQIHLAGHTNHGKYILDTHDDHVIDPVWDLYRRALGRTGPVSTLVEWDDNFPPFAELEAEAAKARVIRDEVAVRASPESAPAPLRELQRFLADALRREVPIPDDPACAVAAREHVAGNDRLTPAEQADLYREQFWFRHVDSLIEDYPGLRALLGEDVFDALARAYLAAHPPRTPSLRELGAELAPFAEQWSRARGLPADVRAAALEMLAYEQRFIDSFDGADPPPLDAAKLQAVGDDAWERARIVLHPLLARLWLAYPMHLYRLAAIDDSDATDATDATDARHGEPTAPREPPPFPERRAVSLVLYRRDLVIRYDEIEPSALALLDALASGESLGAACERVSATLDPSAAEAFGAKVGPWFQDWTAKGWIVDVIV